jgi:hypothetical protein
MVVLQHHGVFAGSLEQAHQMHLTQKQMPKTD